MSEMDLSKLAEAFGADLAEMMNGGAAERFKRNVRPCVHMRARVEFDAQAGRGKVALDTVGYDLDELGVLEELAGFVFSLENGAAKPEGCFSKLGPAEPEAVLEAASACRERPSAQWNAPVQPAEPAKPAARFYW